MHDVTTSVINYRPTNGQKIECKLKSKVKFFNFVPFSRLINSVPQRRKTKKKNTWEVVNKP